MRSIALGFAASLPARFFAVASLLAFGLGGACGGKQLSGGSGDAGSVYTEPDGATCVDIDLSTYDTSCNQASDCTLVQGGTVCGPQCNCGGVDAVNGSEQSRYQNAIASLPSCNDYLYSTCAEPAQPTECIHHTCCNTFSTNPVCHEDSDAGG
jgi:hypothetical protein